MGKSTDTSTKTKDSTDVLHTKQSGHKIKKSKNSEERPASSKKMTMASKLTDHPTAPPVPWAQPRMSDKGEKELYGLLLEFSKKDSTAIAKGVKEAQKAITRILRGNYASAPAVAILGADVHPGDLISHFPVMCEQRAIPYVWVANHHDLGRAQNSNRAIAVTVVLPHSLKGNAKEDSEEKKKKKHSKEFDKIVKLVDSLQIKYF